MKTYTINKGYEITRLLSGRSNVFLLNKDNKFILTDTSVASRGSRLMRKIEEQGIQKLDYLVLTHAHFDHAANAAIISKNYGACVAVHEEEAEFLALGDNVIPNGSNFLTRALIRLLGKLYFRRCR
jgi:hydroxyacylglutathione hydrolase